MYLHLKYVTDENGKKKAVQVPFDDWKKIQRDLEELDQLKNKKTFLVELAEAVEEMKQVKEGKAKARNAEDFLNEL